MAGRYDDIKGSASAEANRAAAAAVRAPEFLKTVAAAQVDPTPGPADVPAPVDDPTDDVDEPDGTPTDTDEGPSPEPAPRGDDEDEDDEVSEDYDDDEAAEDAPDDDDEDDEADRSKTTATVDPADEKTWGQYETDAERKKALAENKRYGIEMAAKAKRLEEENAALKAGKPPADAPAPAPVTAAPEDLEAFATRLVKERADVKQALDAIGAVRADLTTKSEALVELKKAKVADDAAALKLTHRIEYLQERAAKDPENFELANEIDKLGRDLSRLEMQRDGKDVRITKAELEIDRLQGDWNARSDHFQRYIVGEHGKVAETAKASVQNAEAAKQVEKDWETQTAKLFADRKIDDPKLIKRINDRLLDRADTVVTYHGQIPNLGEWLAKEFEAIDEEHAVVRGVTVKEYADKKKRHAEAPGPKGAAAVASPKKQGRLSSKEMDRIANEQMRSFRFR